MSRMRQRSGGSEREGVANRTFYGCSNYPTCKFSVSRKPLPQPCPQCSKLLVASGHSNARCTECEYSGPIPEAAEAVEVAV